MQQGMLFHSLCARQPGVDVEQLLITLPEALKTDPFERAWRWAAQRHAILRTVFHWEEADQPFQAVHAGVEPELVWHDWRALAPADRERRWEELLSADRRRGFDLRTPPLWRLAVVQVKPREYRLVFTFHHLLLDGRALVVLLTEVFEAYATLAKGGEPAAPPPAPYRDYIIWLQTHDWHESELYWRRVLRGVMAPTALPGSATAAGTQAAVVTVHREQEIVLSTERTDALRGLAQHHGLTLNTLVLGAWALLLGRYSGENNVLFGAVRACRHTTVENAESMVGLLINTLPLRVMLPPGQPAIVWLQILREQWVALRPYENTPLAELQGWTEVPRGTPLFESIVNYQEPDWGTALQSLGGAWKRRGFGIRSQPNYPLALDAAGAATLALKILYDPSRFAEATVGRMLGHLSTLLQGMAANPLMPISQLPLLTAGERQRILTDWNGTPADYPDRSGVHHLFEAQAARTPDALAVTDHHRQLRYRDLNAQALQRARELHALGVGPDVCVGVCLPRSVNFVVSVLAVLKAGGAYVPLDPDGPDDRLVFMLADAKASVLVTQRQLAPKFAAASVRTILVDGSQRAHQPAASAPAVPVASSPDHLAYVIYTSGSTGTPKGVAIQHRSVCNLIAWHQRTYQVTPADRVTQLASPAFDASGWELWPYLAAGASVHIPPEAIRLDPQMLVHWLASRQITLAFLPTPMAEALMDTEWPEDIALRALLTGGDRLRRWPGDRLPCRLVNHYGPTECTVVATWMPVSPEAEGALSPLIGKPIDNTEAYVLDPQQQPLPAGVPGELYLGGVGLARGYQHHPELTREKFLPHPFKPGALLYRTGDLVRWLPDGNLEFLGRLDQQIKIRGHRIEPGEIEARLNAHPQVRESLVITREDGAGQTHLIAYLLPPPGEPAPAPRELATLLRTHLPAYMLPAAFVTVAGWPLTANGKVDHARLPAPDRLGYDSSPPFAPPKSKVEETVAQVWAEVLGRVEIGAHDDFFELGGHSLRAAQVISRLNSIFQTALSVRSLFDHSTVTSLAKAIEKQAGHRPLRPAPALVRVDRGSRQLPKGRRAARPALIPRP